MRASIFGLMGFVCVLALGGCVSAPVNQGPIAVRQAGSEVVLAHSALLDQTNHMAKHLDQNKTILYFQNFGGGGAAAGLLLGPLGVAANIKAIDSNTSKDVNVLLGKIAADPGLAFKSAAARSGVVMREQPDGQASRVTPYLYVVKTQQEPDVLAVAASLIVESPLDKATTRKNAPAEPQWRHKYMYQLPGKHTPSSLAALDDAAKAALQAELDAGYSQILAMMARDTAENAAKEQKVKFKSSFLVPRFDFEQMGNLIAEEQDVVWIRNATGVYGIRRESYQPQLQKQARR